MKIEVVEHERLSLSEARAMLAAMGEYHQHFALACMDEGVCSALLASLDGEPVGVGIVYGIGEEEIDVGVIYYVVVREGFRGLGLGKILVASAEEVLSSRGARALIATTRRDNSASRRLFASLGYSEYLIEALDWRARELVERAACAYEDDYLCVKGASSISALVESLERNLSSVENVWRRICYYPWLRRARFLRAARRR